MEEYKDLLESSKILSVKDFEKSSDILKKSFPYLILTESSTN